MRLAPSALGRHYHHDGSANLTTAATILLVDDERDILHITSQILKDANYGILTAASASEALWILSENPKIDLLITDFLMPGMTGVELAVTVQQLHPNLPIAVATAFGQFVKRLPPGVDVIDKPYDFDVLLTRIRKAVGAT